MKKKLRNFQYPLEFLTFIDIMKINGILFVNKINSIRRNKWSLFIWIKLGELLFEISRSLPSLSIQYHELISVYGESNVSHQYPVEEIPKHSI